MKREGVINFNFSEQIPEKKSKEFDFAIEAASDIGKKTHFEDERCILLNFEDILSENSSLKPFSTNFTYFGIFDGHGGNFSSKYLRQNLHLVIISQLEKAIDALNPKASSQSSDSLSLLNIRQILIDSFNLCDKNLLQELYNNNIDDGSCAVITLRVNNIFYTANVGDSRAILARMKDNSLKPIPLTRDHNIGNTEERTRIQNAGCEIINGRVNGRIMVTRSFGDASIKKQTSSQIASPYISRFTHNNEASDGFWSVFSTNESIQFLHKLQKEQHEPEPEDFKNICRRLVKEAIFERKAKDNTTVIVFLFI